VTSTRAARRNLAGKGLVKSEAVEKSNELIRTGLGTKCKKIGAYSYSRLAADRVDHRPGIDIEVDRTTGRVIIILLEFDIFRRKEI
jgi:hypothetical protein